MHHDCFYPYRFLMKSLYLVIISSFFFLFSNAQSTSGNTEKIVTDTICNCLNGVDLTKITNKQDAVTAFTTCFAKRMDLLMQVAREKNIDITDKVAMRNLGIEIGKNLLNENCKAFISISVKMAQNDHDDADNQGSTEGKLKKIELKGFNYIVITDGDNNEKSFIWLQQFPGSDRFMNGMVGLTGKHVNVKWQEIEVYLPTAKGYYKIKEITGVEFL